MTDEAEPCKKLRLLTILLDTLITSKTRIKLLLKFYLNTSTRGYLRNLSAEFNESSNAIRVELNRLEEAGILESVPEGNKRFFKANTRYPLFKDLIHIVHRYVGIDKIVQEIAMRIGSVDQVFLTGPIVHGIDQGIIDLALVGKHIDREYLARLAYKAEGIISRKISYVCFEPDAFLVHQHQKEAEFFLIWDKNQ